MMYKIDIIMRPLHTGDLWKGSGDVVSAVYYIINKYTIYLSISAITAETTSLGPFSWIPKYYIVHKLSDILFILLLPTPGPMLVIWEDSVLLLPTTGPPDIGGIRTIVTYTRPPAGDIGGLCTIVTYTRPPDIGGLCTMLPTTGPLI